MRLQSTILPISTSYLLGLIAVLVAATAAYFTFGSTGERPAEIFGAAATDTLAAATRITVRDGDERVTLRRESDRWVVAEKDGYPAVQDDVARLLDRIRTPGALRQISTDRDRWADIGVGTDDGAWDRRIVIDGPDGDTLALVVGVSRSAPGSKDMTAVPVRRADTDRVWLVDADLRAPAGPMAWIDPQVLAVPRGQIGELRTLPASGEPLVLRRSSPEATHLEAVNLPDGDTPIQPGAATEPAKAFTRLVFEDVRRADPAGPPDENAGRLRTLAGTVVSYWFEEIDGSTWARFAVDQDEPAGYDDGPEADPDAGEEAGIWTPPGVNLADWAFRLPAYEIERMRRAVSELPRR